jgi:LmbE family N-acetylglucosaminyl deacetylase/CheY-like chemotaxis protein
MQSSAFRVLVVDDDPDVALYVATVLERRAGLETLAIHDPLSVQAAARDFAPDVVVADIEMPGLTGLELASALKEDDPDLPVVIMTAHVSVDYAVAALRRQADEFLTKPIVSAELVAIVTRLATGYRERVAARRSRRVLAIGAHPDDVEIGIGGTLCAHRDAGDSIVILTMSRGGQGGAPDDRQSESLSAAETLGARLFLEDLVDTEIAPTGPTVAAIERVIREVQPSVVYTHSVNDRHQDHRAVHHATTVAARSIDMVACYQSPSATVEFRPTRFVSIDGYTDAKLELLSCFRSQAGIRRYLEPDFVLATARYWSRFSATSDNCEPLEIIRDDADLSIGGRQAVSAVDRYRSRGAS